jgi:hypothetical protein
MFLFGGPLVERVLAIELITRSRATIVHVFIHQHWLQRFGSVIPAGLDVGLHLHGRKTYELGRRCDARDFHRCAALISDPQPPGWSEVRGSPTSHLWMVLVEDDPEGSNRVCD